MKNYSSKFKISFKFIVIVFSFSFFIFSFILVKPTRAQSASLYLSPASGTFFVGSTFDISVFVNTEDNSIIAVQADLKFPPSILQVTSPTAGSSFISIWADQPFYSNKEGLISFKGGVPSPGINTSAGLVSTISFRAKAPGVATISFLDSSKVLLADPQGTNILKTSTGGEYTLTIRPPEGPEIFSDTHPSLTAWYKNNNPHFYWKLDLGVTDFSYSLDRDPEGIPDNSSEGKGTSVSFSDVPDGIWYFHLKAKKEGVWGGVSHYPIHIDVTSPGDFKIEIERVGTVTGSRFFAHFSTSDLLSGISHYEVAFVNMEDPQALASPFFVEAVSPYRIPYEKPGKYAIVVKAYDTAGNSTEGRSVLTIVSPLISYTEKGIRIKGVFSPWWVIYSLVVLSLILMAFGILRFWQKRSLARRLRKEVREAEKEIEDVRRLEERIRKMRALAEEAKKEEERLAKRLRGEEEITKKSEEEISTRSEEETDLEI